VEQNDQEGVRILYDDNFFDDTGVDPADHYDNDNDDQSTLLDIMCSYLIAHLSLVILLLSVFLTNYIIKKCNEPSAFLMKLWCPTIL
jgi:hypothetical protein